MELPVPKNKPSSSSSMLFLKCRLQQLTVGVVLSVFLPRLGPGRALWVALRSRLFSRKPYHYSIRPQVSEIKTWINRTPDEYLVVTGLMSVGKTCLIDTAVNKMAGVIRVVAFPGDSASTITERVMFQLTNMNTRINVCCPFRSGSRVVFWFTLFFRRPPTVVINTYAGPTCGQQYGQLSYAVKTLAERYGLRVIVDGPDYLHSYLMRTHYQRTMRIEPMSEEMIRSISELSLLFGLLKQAKLERTVFQILGGFPSQYIILQRILKQLIEREGNDPQNIKKAISDHLCKEIDFCCDKLKRFCSIASIDIFKMVTQYEQKGYLQRQTIYPRNTWRSNPDPEEIFQQINRNGVSMVFIPRNKSIQIALKNNLVQPSFDVIQKLLQSNSKAIID